MTCRHAYDDPKCSDYASNIRRAQDLLKKAGKLDEFSDFDIQDVARYGPHLVLKVVYPEKPSAILVFLNVTEAQVIRWRKIVPSFQVPASDDPRFAPGVSAMFAPTDEGWNEATAYAQARCSSQL